MKGIVPLLLETYTTIFFDEKKKKRKKIHGDDLKGEIFFFRRRGKRRNIVERCYRYRIKEITNDSGFSLSSFSFFFSNKEEEE